MVFDGAVDCHFLNHSDFLARLEDLAALPGPTGLPLWPDYLVRLTLILDAGRNNLLQTHGGSHEKSDPICVSLAPALAAPAHPLPSQPSPYHYTLPLALEAAAEAVQVCARNGYAVTATVVDMDRIPQVALRGDGATVHTRESSFQKAYTVVTLGPMIKIAARFMRSQPKTFIAVPTDTTKVVHACAVLRN